MASQSVALLCFLAAVITILSPVTDSSPISLEDDRPNPRRFHLARNQEDESSEDGAQTFGEAQEGAEDSSEEEGVFGSSFGGGVGTDPPVLPPVEPSPGTSYPSPQPETPGGDGGLVTQTPTPSMTPGPVTVPPETPPTTPPRGDGGTGVLFPRRSGGGTPNLRPFPNPVRPAPPPKINNNIAAISHEVEKPTHRGRSRVPLGALLTVVVIGGLVVVMAVGGVAYFFATRVRIS